METAPAECHVCAALFDPDRGGTCSRCGRPACGRHIRLAGFLGAEALSREMLVCVRCLGRGERSVRFKMKYFAGDPFR